MGTSKRHRWDSGSRFGATVLTPGRQHCYYGDIVSIRTPSVHAQHVNTQTHAARPPFPCGTCAAALTFIAPCLLGAHCLLQCRIRGTKHPPPTSHLGHMLPVWTAACCHFLHLRWRSQGGSIELGQEQEQQKHQTVEAGPAEYTSFFF